jgi:quercetin dioxygenase-like cupin family protein
MDGSETLTITPTESVTIRHSSAEALEVEALYAPEGHAPPKHFHPDQDEHFEVLEGELRTRVDGTEQMLSAGETIDIPRGAVHQMWNPAGEPARVVWRTTPRLRTERWFRAIDRLHREGKVGGNGMPGPLLFAALLTEFRDVFRLAVAPDVVTRPLLSALAVPGRMRGALPPG